MVFIGFGCFSRFWAGLVVVALVGMSGKRGNVWFSLLVDNSGDCPLWPWKASRPIPLE